MYERMLNKSETPSYEEMALYCRDQEDLFLELNNWISTTFQTEIKIVFPYGNAYGWGASHRYKGKLFCNVFPEDNSFTVMVRLTKRQFNLVYSELRPYSKKIVDSNYPCNDGGWIHYRVLCKEDYLDIKKLLGTRIVKKETK